MDPSKQTLKYAAKVVGIGLAVSFFCTLAISAFEMTFELVKLWCELVLGSLTIGAPIAAVAYLAFIHDIN